MHEMAIAEGILDIALDYARQNKAQKVNEVGLLLGEMSGVEVDSLEFSFTVPDHAHINKSAPTRCAGVDIPVHSVGVGDNDFLCF